MNSISFSKTFEKTAIFGAFLLGFWVCLGRFASAEPKADLQSSGQSSVDSSTKSTQSLEYTLESTPKSTPQSSADFGTQSADAKTKEKDKDKKESAQNTAKDSKAQNPKTQDSQTQDSKTAQKNESTKSSKDSKPKAQESAQDSSKASSAEASSADFSQEKNRNDESFITPQEYGASLYEYPRGIGCIKCHGYIGEETLLATYTHKGKQKVLLVPRINNLELSHFKSALSQDKGIMPKYNLTDEEIQAIFLYISSKNPTKIK